MLPLTSIASLAAKPSSSTRRNVVIFGHDSGDDSEAPIRTNEQDTADAFDRLFMIKSDMTEEEIQVSRQQLATLNRTMRRYAINRQEAMEDGDSTTARSRSSRPRLF